MSTFTGSGSTVVLTTTIPADNAPLMASDINVPVETLFNNDAALLANANGKVSKAGDIMTGVLDVLTGAGTSINTSGQINAGGDVILESDAFTLTINGATNATPIVIQTTVPHNLVQGALVTIAGVGGNTNANGQWPIQLFGPTNQFSLVNSAGNSAYTSGGTVQRDAQAMYGTARPSTRVLTRYWNDGGMSTGSTPATTKWTVNPNVTQPAPIALGIATNPSATIVAQYFGFEIGADDAPTGSSLLHASVCYQPLQGGHTGVPVGQPLVRVFKQSVAFGNPASTLLASQQDAATTVVQYESYTVTTAVLATAEIIDHTRFRYFVVFTTEGGTNAIDSVSVYGAAISITAPGLDQF